jgi:hypothetical protein
MTLTAEALWQRLLGRPASESGRLCHGDGGCEGGDRPPEGVDVGYPLTQDVFEAIRTLLAMASSGPYVAQAPLAIVVATEKSRFAVSDASRAIQSMLLVAWAEGVGSNWVGFGGLDKVKALLDIPAGHDVFAILPFGYPARAVGRGKKQRKPLRQVAHLERYGRPFE